MNLFKRLNTKIQIKMKNLMKMIMIALGAAMNRKMSKFIKLLIRYKLIKTSNFLKIKLNLVKKKNRVSNRMKYLNHKKLSKLLKCS
jgi:hypothetical protein